MNPPYTTEVVQKEGLMLVLNASESTHQTPASNSSRPKPVYTGKSTEKAKFARRFSEENFCAKIN